MAITASGRYNLTQEKKQIDTLGQSFEAETHKGLLVTDSEAPNFDTHDFRNDITAEVTGTGYTAGGATVTGTEITVVSGSLKYDYDDPQWTTSTIANAMAFVWYFNVGTAATDPLDHLLDFVTAVSTSAGLLLVTIHANGAILEDNTP
jgi:hypothetical protein